MVKSDSLIKDSYTNFAIGASLGDARSAKELDAMREQLPVNDIPGLNAVAEAEFERYREIWAKNNIR